MKLFRVVVNRFPFSTDMIMQPIYYYQFFGKKCSNSIGPGTKGLNCY